MACGTFGGVGYGSFLRSWVMHLFAGGMVVVCCSALYGCCWWLLSVAGLVLASLVLRFDAVWLVALGYV